MSICWEGLGALENEGTREMIMQIKEDWVLKRIHASLK